jgi:hypothetical protein
MIKAQVEQRSDGLAMYCDLKVDSSLICGKRALVRVSIENIAEFKVNLSSYLDPFPSCYIHLRNPIVKIQPLPKSAGSTCVAGS